MSRAALRSTPPWSAVAGEQLRAVFLRLRREAVVVALIALAMSATALASASRMRGLAHAGLDFHPGSLMVYALLAAAVPLTLWRGRSLRRGGYAGTMPVRASRNVLLHVGWGWLWTMAMLAGVSVYMVMIVHLSGGDLGVDVAFAYLRDPATVADTEANLRVVRLDTPAWQWIAPFTGATAVYLLASFSALATRRAIPWIVVTVLGWNLVASATAGPPGREAPVHEAVSSVWNGRYGMLAALAGVTEASRPIRLPDGTPATRRGFAPDRDAWLGATLLWLTLGTAATVAAAHLRREE